MANDTRKTRMGRFTRREALELAGVGALAATGASLAPPVRAAHHEKRGASGNDYDAIVIGAGFAGAVAARDLGKAGMRVLVLEARNRLGGRTFTSSFAGHKIELGGMHIHWLQPHIWAEVTRYGFPMTESPSSNFERFSFIGKDGELRNADPDETLNELVEGIDIFCRDAWDYFPRLFDPLFVDAVKQLDTETIADRLKSPALSDRQRALISAIFGVLAGGDLSEAAASQILRGYAAGGWNAATWLDTLGRYKFANGTLSVITTLLEDSGAEVRLATPVAAITQRDDQVVVTTSGGEKVSARACVVTVPVNVYSQIAFEPGLSRGKAALAREGQMSRGHKVYVHLRENIGRFFAAGIDQPLSWMQTEYYDENGTVLITVGGRHDLLDIHDSKAVAAAVHRYLPDVEVLASVGYDWNADPYSRGAWPAFRAGQLMKRFADLQRTEGNVHFAGSMTASGWYQWIDGAVESGLRAAREIKRKLT